MKKKFIYLCLIVTIVLLGCFEKEKETEELVKTNEEKIITIAEKAEIKTLDPQNTVDSASLSVIQMINQRLFKIDNNGNIIPEIAEEATKVNEKTTLIKIKKDLFFSNGEPVTVDDVLFSLNRAKESPRMTQDFYMIESFEKVDDSTIKVNTFYEAGNLLHKLASMGASIMSKKALEENETNIVGSGMFKLKEWVAGDRLVLERNTYFKDANSNIKEIVIKFIPEANSRMIMLETGEVDIATGMPPVSTQTIEANDKLELISEPTTATEYICLNVEKAPFTNKEFRQALNYAIDKKSIVDSIFSGKGKVAKSIVNPNVFGYYDGLEEYPFNPEKAKELIEKSGVKDKSFSLYVNDSPVRLQVAQIIQANLKDVGIDMKIETLEWGTYLQKTGEGDFTAYLGGWISGTSDADIVLYPLLDSKSIGFPGNRARYSNPEFDKEVEMARVVLTPEERKEHYKNAQIIAREDSPLIVLFNKNENIGINKRILGFEYDPTTMHKFKNLEIK